MRSNSWYKWHIRWSLFFAILFTLSLNRRNKFPKRNWMIIYKKKGTKSTATESVYLYISLFHERNIRCIFLMNTWILLKITINVLSSSSGWKIFYLNWTFKSIDLYTLMFSLSTSQILVRMNYNSFLKECSRHIDIIQLLSRLLSYCISHDMFLIPPERYTWNRWKMFILVEYSICLCKQQINSVEFCRFDSLHFVRVFGVNSE